MNKYILYIIYERQENIMSIFRKKKEKKPNELLLEIANTQMALDTAYSVFENVLDPDLIDSSIYQVNAMHERYKYLIKQLKEAEQTSAVI